MQKEASVTGSLFYFVGWIRDSLILFSNSSQSQITS